MANWQFKLNLNDVWKKDNVELYELAGVVVERLNKLSVDIRKRHSTIYHDMADELENDIIPLFEEINEDSGYDEFNNAMESLYDWADTPLDENSFGGKKMCWIGTIFPV